MPRIGFSSRRNIEMPKDILELILYIELVNELSERVVDLLFSY